MGWKDWSPRIRWAIIAPLAVSILLYFVFSYLSYLASISTDPYAGFGLGIFRGLIPGIILAAIIGGYLAGEMYEVFVLKKDVK